MTWLDSRGRLSLRDFANDQRLTTLCHSHSIVPGGLEVMS